MIDCLGNRVTVFIPAYAKELDKSQKALIIQKVLNQSSGTRKAVRIYEGTETIDGRVVKKFVGWNITHKWR